jgi:hypothetical protein
LFFVELTISRFLLAVSAEATEFRLMVCNLKTGSLGHPLIKLVVYRFIQIENLSTPFASKMIVILSLCLEPAQATIEI